MKMFHVETATRTQHHTFLHYITLKYGCNLTDMLATPRFALLVKTLQWNRKIQCGNSFWRMLSSFKRSLILFGAVFLVIWCGNASLF